MDKITENSILYGLINKPLMLWGLLYCVSVLGVFLKYFFNFEDSFVVIVGIYLLFIGVLGIFGFVEIKSSRDVLKDDKLDLGSKNYLLNYIHDLCYEDKGMIYYKLFIIICFTFLFGFVVPFLDKLTLVDFTCYILTTFGISILALHLLLYDSKGDSLIHNGLYGSFINGLLLIFLTIFKHYFGFFIKIFNIIVSNINNFFILSLTVVLLGATLSLLAFTYNMVLDKEDNVKNEMKLIGEKFFISTLLSMVFLFIIFLLSIYCTYSGILSLGNINFLEPSFFIMVNVFVVLLFLSLFVLMLSLRYLLEGIISSLNTLPFKF